MLYASKSQECADGQHDRCDGKISGNRLRQCLCRCHEEDDDGYDDDER